MVNCRYGWNKRGARLNYSFRLVCAKRLLSLLLLVLALPAVVQAQFTFTTNNGAVTITAYAGSGGTVVIPDMTNGYPVTGIGNYAFAIYAASNPGWNLTNVIIPGSITNIGQQVFYYCHNLLAITVDSSNSAFSSVDGVLFNKSQTSLIEFPEGKSGAYNLPNNVTNIVPYAFQDCFLLTGVTMPNSFISLEQEVFIQCHSLTGVYFKGNAPSYEFESFFNCPTPSIIYRKPRVGAIHLPVFQPCCGIRRRKMILALAC
jgi:BspA type Leucine rich repeat region (6 copies)